MRASEAQRDMADHHLQQADLNLERTVIRAPITGRIQNIFANPGRKQMLASDHPFDDGRTSL